MLLEKKGLKGYQIGESKVFLRAGQMAELDARRSEVLGKSAKIIQCRARPHYSRKQYITLYGAAICIQSSFRANVARKVFEGMRREAAAVRIQKHGRKYQASKKYRRVRVSALVVQTSFRALKARKEYHVRRQNKAATLIQSRWRSHRASSYYKKFRKASLVTQCRWRGRLARRELRKLKMASKETGALQEAKNKLQKIVEDLTMRLKLEKQSRSDLEEEIAQLKAMQSKQHETNSLIEQEREGDKCVIEETQVILEAAEKINSLRAEVESLKAIYEAEKQRADEYDQQFAKVQELSEERLPKQDDSDEKIVHLEESLRRLEEKLTNTESENQVLRQQSFSLASNKYLSGRSMSIQHLHSQSMNHGEREIGETPQKYLNEKQQKGQELLIRCVSQPLGFSGNKPVAACIIYKCLLHWRSFEANRTSIFDQIIQTIGHAIETHDNNDILAYWLSNASTLLLFLQHTLKASSAAASAPKRCRSSSSAAAFGRMAQNFRGIPNEARLPFASNDINGGIDSLHQVEAKYPALLFKQHLTAYVEKIYIIIRDNLKREISPLLGLCIQAPRTSRTSLVKGLFRSEANTAAQQALIAHWQGIVKGLGNFLNTMKENHVPSILVRKIFTQIFSFINVQLFNSLLLKRECCLFNNGEYVKVVHQKPKLSVDEIIHQLCPVLSKQQLYRIGTMYWDDKYGTHSFNPDVIANLRVLMTEDSNNAVSNSLLLADDKSIPFSMVELSKSIDKINVADVEPPPLIRENSAFSFLLPPSE